MTRRLGRNQFFGNFIAERREQIEVFDEKRQVNIVRNRVEGDNLDGEKTPVLVKAAQAGEWQRARAQTGHELALINGFFPMRVDVLVKVVDDRLGFAGFHSRLGWLSSVGVPLRALTWKKFLVWLKPK